MPCGRKFSGYWGRERGAMAPALMSGRKWVLLSGRKASVYRPGAVSTRPELTAFWPFLASLDNGPAEISIDRNVKDVAHAPDHIACPRYDWFFFFSRSRIVAFGSWIKPWESSWFLREYPLGSGDASHKRHFCEPHGFQMGLSVLCLPPVLSYWVLTVTVWLESNSSDR